MMDQDHQDHQKIYVRTPLIESLPLSQLINNNNSSSSLRGRGREVKIFLKLENCQPSGSFKLRGISEQCKYAKTAGFTSVVCSSGGNAGLACAYAARLLHLRAHIVVPGGTPQSVQANIRSFGATVEVYGCTSDDVAARAKQLSNNEMYLVHPSDHPLCWRGHASMVEEIVEDLATFDHNLSPSLFVTCCGGGGLVCGLVDGLLAHSGTWTTKMPDILVMETFGAASFAASVAANGERVRLPSITSIAHSLGVVQVCDRIREAYQRGVRDGDGGGDHGHPHYPRLISRVVTDQQAINACIRFADDHRFLVGPACGATLAAVYDGIVGEELLSRLPGDGDHHVHDRLLPPIVVIVIVCGGAEISLKLLHEYKKSVAI